MLVSYTEITVKSLKHGLSYTEVDFGEGGSSAHLNYAQLWKALLRTYLWSIFFIFSASFEATVSYQLPTTLLIVLVFLWCFCATCCTRFNQQPKKSKKSQCSYFCAMEVGTQMPVPCSSNGLSASSCIREQLHGYGCRYQNYCKFIRHGK